MTRENQKKLLQLHENGFSIHVSNGYVAEMVYTMHKNETSCEVEYSDSAVIDCGLDDVDEISVEVYWRIDDWDSYDTLEELQEATRI